LSNSVGIHRENTVRLPKTNARLPAVQRPAAAAAEQLLTPLLLASTSQMFAVTAAAGFNCCVLANICLTACYIACLQYNDQLLQLLTSSIFLSGAAAALVGMFTSKKLGRRFTMICAGAAFIISKGTGCVLLYWWCSASGS
jgi:hypothetical protein